MGVLGSFYRCVIGRLYQLVLGYTWKFIQRICLLEVSISGLYSCVLGSPVFGSLIVRSI